MSGTDMEQTSTEAVGVFSTADDLQQAIDDLLNSGFDRAELSLLATEAAVDAKLGHAYRKVEALEDDPSVPRTCYVSPESVGDAEGALVGSLLYVGGLAAAGAVVASGGALAAAFGAAALVGGAGGMVGAALASLVGDSHARHLQEHLAHGGLLLWVRTRTTGHERLAMDILRRHSGRDAHVHALR